MNNYKLGIFTIGKRLKKNKRLIIKNSLFMQISILLLICLVTGSVAYLIKQNSLKNEFLIGEVKTEVMEEFDINNKIKQDVRIKNIGNVPIYIRAKIVISWKDEQGNILEGIPEENVDYSIKFSETSNWIKSNDGYYYYKKAIEQNTTTDILIEECKQIKEYEDKILEVSIANQAIQGSPIKAVTEAWNVQVIDEMLVLKE